MMIGKPLSLQTATLWCLLLNMTCSLMRIKRSTSMLRSSPCAPQGCTMIAAARLTCLLVALLANPLT